MLKEETMTFNVQLDSNEETLQTSFEQVSNIKGEDGTTFYPEVSDEGIISWTNDGGKENPQSINIKGKDGIDGVDGYTPTRGIDYWTTDDKTEIVEDTKEAIDLSSYAEKTDLDSYLPLTGGTCTGGVIAPNFQTGNTSNGYFQTRKMRGQGDANTYLHSIDFGYAGHDQVDFYEYGGTWNFWQCQNANKNYARIVGSIKHTTGWNGCATLTGTPTAPTAKAGTNTTQIATTEFVQTAITNSHKQYELIETITMDEDGNLIERTTEPDGTAYNFTTMAIQVSFPTSKSGSKVTNFLINAYVDKDSTSTACEAFRTYTLNQYVNKGTMLVKNDYGMFYIQMSDITSNVGYVNYQSLVPSSYVFGKAIWKLKISTTQDNSLYAGTVINLYGVRAD